MVNRNIGERIRIARKAAGMSQDDVATATGIVQPELSKIERGKRRLYADDLMLIASAVRVSAALLLEDDDELRRAAHALRSRSIEDAEWLIEAGLDIIRQNRG